MAGLVKARREDNIAIMNWIVGYSAPADKHTARGEECSLPAIRLPTERVTSRARVVAHSSRTVGWSAFRRRIRSGVMSWKSCALFEWGRLYEEKEVNAILRQFHDDVASLRREMID